MGAGRIQKLEELGISWNVDKRPDQWEARLQEPKEFEEERGHGRVSVARCKDVGPVGSAVSRAEGRS